MFKDFRDFAMKGNVIDMAVGIVIGSAFGTIVKSLVDDLIMPPIGLLLGGLLPFLVAALTMTAVGKAAFAMVKEVRRQFKEIPGLLEGKAKPDYVRCVDISTKAAIKRMIMPGLLAVFTPVFFFFILENRQML